MILLSFKFFLKVVEPFEVSNIAAKHVITAILDTLLYRSNFKKTDHDSSSKNLTLLSTTLSFECAVDDLASIT